MNVHQIPKGLKKTAVLCVLKNGHQFLLLKRLKEPNKDNYTPVGGKLDPFENPVDAAIRETREETGIQVPAMKYCGVLIESSPADYNWVSFVYLANIDLVSPPPCNEGTLEWIHFDEVLNIRTPKTDWFIYKYILEQQPFAINAVYDEELNLLNMSEDISATDLFKDR
ncbi:MAG: NUDIX domain-containing protein [Chitinophagaceae bacterium]|nr:NUDIX domain-containing protein [Chitinophagaceae bacterium]